MPVTTHAVIVPPVLLQRLRAAGIARPDDGARLSAEQMQSLLAAQHDPGERIFVRSACAQCGIAPAGQG